MKRIFLLLSLFICNTLMSQNAMNYNKEWRLADSLATKQLPESVLKQVSLIYDYALAHGDYGQALKAVIYRHTALLLTKANDIKAAVDTLKKEIDKFPQPAKSVVYALIANVYRDYLHKNVYRIQSRTYSEDVSDDPTVWSAKRLFDETVKYCNLSLHDEALLKKAPLTDFKEIVEYDRYDCFAIMDTHIPDFPTVDFMTLHNFLLFNKIHALQDDWSLNLSQNLSQNIFVINKPDFFADANTFINYSIDTKDVDTARSPEYCVITLYQQLLHSLLQSGKQETFTIIDVERLNYIRDKGVYDNTNELYEQALKSLMQNCNNENGQAYVAYNLACLYWIQGEKWKNDKSNPMFRYRLKDAYNLCAQTLAKTPSNSKITEYLHDLQEKLSQQDAKLTFENAVSPGVPVLALAQYRNLDTLYIKVYPISEDEAINLETRGGYSMLYYRLSDKVKPVAAQKINLPHFDDFQAHSAEVMLNPILKQGFYFVSISNQDSLKVNDQGSLMRVQLIQISPLSIISQQGNNNAASRMYIVDRQTGKPASNAKVEFFELTYDNNKQKIISATTYSDNEGFVSRQKKGRVNGCIISHNGSRLVTIHDMVNSFDRNETRTTALFFTDRAIYRPGQTVYYKALLFKDKELAPKQSFKVEFKDANRQVVATREHTSNNYGSVEGSFSIPQGMLNGTMTLYSEYGATSIQVEEYKRPTFEVKFDDLARNYRFGDTIQLTGFAKAFAGYSIDNAKVKYRVVRNVEYRYWWYPHRNQPSREIASGKIATDAQGAFSIVFDAKADDVKTDDDAIYRYETTVDVTDANGETHSAQLAVRVGKKPLQISADVPQSLIAGDSLLFPLNTTNLNGDFTPADVAVTITSLKAPSRILNKRQWEMPDTVALSRKEFEKHFPHEPYGDETNCRNYPKDRQIAAYRTRTTDAQSSRLDLSSLNTAGAGWYRIDIKATNGDAEVEDVQFVQIVGIVKNGVTRPTAIKTMDDWFCTIKDGKEPGENLEFWLAGANNKNYVTYDIYHDDKLIEHRSLVVKTPEKVVFPIKEEHRGGLTVVAAMAENGKFYTTHKTFPVMYSNKKLDITFNTFRDKLLPGESEKWSLTVKDNQGKGVTAEMVATLYDASLDAFRTHNFPSNGFIYQQKFSYNYWQQPTEIRLSYLVLGNDFTVKPFYYLLPYLLKVAFSHNRDSLLATKSLGYRRKQIAVALYSESDVANAAVYAEETENDSSVDSDDTPDIPLRSNFNETAFFYPQLRTDTLGNLSIEFTVPEALTSWRMLGFAHTKDLKTGNTSNALITQKQVAISANAPRFFRENDVIEFTAKVNNIVGEDLSGEALLQLYDAVTMQEIDAQMLKSEARQKFNVKTGGSAGLKWTLTVPENLQAVTYRVSARAGAHTDGEEKTVPVLKNSTLVTETLPFSVRGGERKELVFAGLRNNKSATLRNHRLTLEFTSNPAWYAVQALPYLMEYPYECAEQVFARFYANSIATGIVNSSPKIRQIFELWGKLPENKNALLSNLEKNQELKQALLEETPWVMQAQDESERKKRVGLLFDLNRMSAELSAALQKLQKKQSVGGGFPWFEGMPDSRCITLHIVAGMEHLKRLNALDGTYTDKVNRMVTRAFNYLDAEVERSYNALKRHVGSGQDLDAALAQRHIGTGEVQYLYACSFQKRQPAGEAFKYFYAQAKRYRTSFDLYSQAMIALVMHRYGDDETAAAIMRSLKERAQKSDDMGMYWNDNVAGYFWHQAPIETQALLIEAFTETGETRDVEEMKIWLLRNKQTNDWRTTKATSEACYALLLNGSALLDNNALLDVSIAGKPLARVAVETISPEAGTIYVKTAWNGSDVSSDKAALSVVNPNKNGIAWGGMYWQYFEQYEKIASSDAGLKIAKQLYRKINTPQGPQLQTLNGDIALNVGDLVTVRMELRADRDYEYVHLKDLRASTLEPVKTLSGCRYQDGLWYYENIKDAATDFFITYLNKGVYVFEYELRVTHAGTFSAGLSTFQCMYAPEFNAHSEGLQKISVK